MPNRVLVIGGLLVLWISSTVASAADQALTGEEIYQRQCASCHGEQGQGVKEHYADPLRRRHALDELTKLIHDTMPEDDPESCVDDNARRVAVYLMETIYPRNEQQAPSRIELSRLTVRQYSHCVTDLLGGFLGQQWPDEQRGLKGRYYNDKGFRGDKMAFERIDEQVDFHFADKSPDTEKVGVEEFSIQWQGGVIAEETGEYDFVVETENGARLWINDSDKPLIDAWVKSGSDTVHRGSIRLLGGRVYHLRLDFFKFKDKTAAVTLRWQPPKRALQAIPPRNLCPGRFPYCFVLETPFPPDDSSMGYERGTSVSPEWNAAATRAALEVTKFVVEKADRLAGTKEDAQDRADRWKAFCHRFAERAFRRPLDEEQKGFYVDRHWKGEIPASALHKTVLQVLLSPRFLYAEMAGETVDDFDVASRLALGLWDSLPDAPLLEAASKGSLHTPPQVSVQARRMLDDQRTHTKVREYFHKWLPVERLVDISKDKELGFDPAIAADLQTSLDLFLDDVVWGPRSDYRQLFLSDEVFLNQRLSEFYQSGDVKGVQFQKVKMPPAQRCGVLTHPGLMTGLAYYRVSSPIHRGVFLARSILGRTLKAPPIAVSPIDEGLNPDMTTRERVAFQTSPTACQSCHGLINSLGFALEHYDAVGRFRVREKDKPIDATGLYRPLAGQETRFDGARQLAEYLAQSGEAHEAFVQQLFQYMIRQPVTAYGPHQLDQLAERFSQSGFQIPPLLVDIVQSSVLQSNPKETGT